MHLFCYFLYILLTLDARNRWLQGQDKGMHCSHIDHGYITTTSTYQRGKKPEREYTTWKEWKKEYNLMKPKFNEDSTIRDLYDPAMKITNKGEAKEYFEALVEHSMMGSTTNTYEEAVKVEKENLAYHAGHYSNKVRERVEKLYDCKHPVFGSIAENGPPTPEEAFEAGKRMALRS